METSNCRIRPGITGTGLKWVAAAAMLLDHIRYILGGILPVPEWFSVVGRLAAPLFLFCLVEGWTHTRSRPRYFLRVLALAVPMGIALFRMRYAGTGVRPDGFFPENSMLLTFVLLMEFFFALDLLTRPGTAHRVSGVLALAGLLAWPFLAGLLTVRVPGAAGAVGLLCYTLLPLPNLTGDLSLPVLLSGLALFLFRHKRSVQLLALFAVEFGWHFCLVLAMLHSQPGFRLAQMFTTYYEWLGAVFAIPLLLCYNGRRGRGHAAFFYAFYPAHIYLLYAVSWLLLL